MTIPFQEEWLELPPRPPMSRRNPRVKELTFPAPLSYFGKAPEVNVDDMLGPLPSPGSGVGRRLPSSASSSSYAPSIVSVSRTSTITSETSSSHGTRSERRLSKAPSSKNKKRTSIFGGGRSGRVPLPAPRSAPSSFYYYNTGASSGWRKRTTPTDGCLSEDEYPLVAPRKPWHDRHHRSTASSSISAHNSSESISSLSARSGQQTFYGGQRRLIAPRYVGPHDLASATVRTRAPLLRVFVPCSRITQGVLREVENQLRIGGLWEYVYVGDVICNLGYVGGGDEDEGIGEWLILKSNQEGLVVAPLESSTVSNPLPTYYTLPSPFYYSPFLPREDPIITLAFPPSSLPPHSPLTLTHSTQVTTTSHTMRVKKYVWITSMYVDAPPVHLGEGWKGEWVLEGEGTREGKVSLERAIAGVGGEFCWEVIRERCNDGLIWMRLLTQPPSRLELLDAMHRL